jgi:hypothetical protein
LSEVDDEDVSEVLGWVPTVHATSTAPAAPAAARVTVSPPTLRSPFSRAAMT